MTSLPGVRWATVMRGGHLAILRSALRCPFPEGQSAASGSVSRSWRSWRTFVEAVICGFGCCRIASRPGVCQAEKASPSRPSPGLRWAPSVPGVPRTSRGTPGVMRQGSKDFATCCRNDGSCRLPGPRLKPRDREHGHLQCRTQWVASVRSIAPSGMLTCGLEEIVWSTSAGVLRSGRLVPR